MGLSKRHLRALWHWPSQLLVCLNYFR